MASLKTDKSVRWIGWGVFDPRVKTRGYTELADDRDQLNLPIYRLDNTPPTHNPSSVSTDYSYLKTDESVRWMGWGAYNPRVETRGYPELVDDRDQLNPLIHRWDNTSYPYNPLSVLTDYRIQTHAGGEC